MTKGSKGSFANVEDARAALRESMVQARRSPKQPKRGLAKKGKDARNLMDDADSPRI